MKKKYFIILVILSLSTISCQDEVENKNINLKESFTKTSALTILIKRVAQSRTTFDNIIDGTSCFSVQLPVTVTANLHQFTIETENDYHQVVTIFNESLSDDDVVHFHFPITLTYQNFQQIVVTSQNQLDNILANCPPSEDFHEINCIDFNLPVKINSYNSENQLSNSETIQSNSQLYNFIANINNDTILSIVYPISMTNSSGQIITINNNTELKTVIETVINQCDDFIGVVDPVLADIIIDGTWYISSYLDEEENETSDYYGYNFTFLSNGNLTAVKNAVTINGTWTIVGDGVNKKLDINFVGDTIEDIEEDWKVIEFNASNIRLKHISGGDGETHYLNFAKN